MFIWGLKYWEPKSAEKNLCFTFQQDLGHDLKSLVWGEDRRGEYTKHEMCFLYGYISRNPSHVSRCVVKLPHTRQQLNCASLYIVAEDRPNICGKKRKKIHTNESRHVRNSCAALSAKDSNPLELSSISFHVLDK